MEESLFVFDRITTLTNQPIFDKVVALDSEVI